jgi:hypothetical protein
LLILKGFQEVNPKVRIFSNALQLLYLSNFISSNQSPPSTPFLCVQFMVVIMANIDLLFSAPSFSLRLKKIFAFSFSPFSNQMSFTKEVEKKLP